jgi:peptidoglycan/xylan/chitin deacetylase (PgdA/CDA1 family)
MESVLWTLGGLGTLWWVANYHWWRLPKPDFWPRILMYHSVEPGEASGMNVTPEQFERHLAYLSNRGYRFLTMSELRDASTDELRESKTVVLTFDDGFANNHTWAFPLLRRYGARATIYLAPDIQGIKALTEEQVKEMSDSGLVEFGAHTLTHVNLTSVPDDEARRQIEGSVQKVARTTGRPCRTFAYPFGRYAPQHVDMVRDSGCDTAVTVRKAIDDPSGSWLELPRVGISGKMNAWQYHIALTRGRYRF